MNYTETESKVREATNDDPWGPSGQLMGEIARQVFFFLMVLKIWWLLYLHSEPVSSYTFLRYGESAKLCLSSFSMQGYVHVRAVSRGYEYAVDQNAERQQEELEKSLQGMLYWWKYQSFVFAVIGPELYCPFNFSLYCCWDTWLEMDLNVWLLVQESTYMTCVQLKAIIV